MDCIITGNNVILKKRFRVILSTLFKLYRNNVLKIELEYDLQIPLQKQHLKKQKNISYDPSKS